MRAPTRPDQFKPDHRMPIFLKVWDDAYTLGAFCVKAQLVPYAEIHLKHLDDRRHPRTRLFRSGAADAESFTWDDLAFEIQHLRAKSPERFDAYFKRNLHRSILSAMTTALESATDWETKDQIKLGETLTDCRQS